MLKPTTPNNAAFWSFLGYQRQLTYAHPDGSYSMFGPSQQYQNKGDEPSLWLTASVVKNFGHAKPFIHIDESQLQKSVEYIVNKQDPWGCFPEVCSYHSSSVTYAHLSAFSCRVAGVCLLIHASFSSHACAFSVLREHARISFLAMSVSPFMLQAL